MPEVDSTVFFNQSYWFFYLTTAVDSAIFCLQLKFVFSAIKVQSVNHNVFIKPMFENISPNYTSFPSNFATICIYFRISFNFDIFCLT